MLRSCICEFSICPGPWVLSGGYYMMLRESSESQMLRLQRTGNAVFSPRTLLQCTWFLIAYSSCDPVGESLDFWGCLGFLLFLPPCMEKGVHPLGQWRLLLFKKWQMDLSQVQGGTLVVTFLLAPRTRVIDWIWALSLFSLATGTVTILLDNETNWVTDISLLKAAEKQTEERGFNRGSWIVVLSSV